MAQLEEFNAGAPKTKIPFFSIYPTATLVLHTATALIYGASIQVNLVVTFGVQIMNTFRVAACGWWYSCKIGPGIGR